MQIVGNMRILRALLLYSVLAIPVGIWAAGNPGSAAGQSSSAEPSASVGSKLFTPEDLNKLLPQGVWFSGKSAPLQLRNSGGVRFSNGLSFWAAMVDTSGYASNVQEKYQFYLVTEGPVEFGGKLLPPGAYGAGFVANDRFVVMDVGGHTVLEGATNQDDAMKRPRPLELLTQPDGKLRLYLGRRYVMVQPGR